MSMRSPSPGPLVCVVGARPNYMKMAPLLRAFTARGGLPDVMLAHTCQHYDLAMNERLFSDLQLPAPDLNLEVGSGTHAVQTAEVMRRFEPVVDDVKPSCVIVVGDVNSTLACSLVASKKRIPIAHVEAGLRSFDREMPEEINRLLTDQLADILYTTERDAATNLAREGIDASRVRFVGNVMIDSLLAHKARAVPPETTLARAGFDPHVVSGAAGFGDWRAGRRVRLPVTLHRPSNVDSRESFAEAVAVLTDVAQRIPLVWPVHPRARANIDNFGLAATLRGTAITLLDPQGYLAESQPLEHR